VFGDQTVDTVSDISAVHATPPDVECENLSSAFMKNRWRLLKLALHRATPRCRRVSHRFI